MYKNIHISISISSDKPKAIYMYILIKKRKGYVMGEVWEERFITTGTVPPDFFLWFFHQTTSASQVRRTKKGFRFFEYFGVVIRICNRPSVVFTTVES